MENKLKKCPFCGSEAVMHTVYGIEEYAKYKSEIPKGARIDRAIGDENGEIKYFEFRRLQYVPQCSDSKCCGRTTKRFDSEEEAKNAWNRRETNESTL